MTSKKLKAEIICPHCNSKVYAIRNKKGKMIITTSSGIALAVIGGIIGAGMGIASYGWGIPATIPLGVAGLVVGSGAGYIISDKIIDKIKCPKCKKRIDL